MFHHCATSTEHGAVSYCTHIKPTVQLVPKNLFCLNGTQTLILDNYKIPFRGDRNDDQQKLTTASEICLPNTNLYMLLFICTSLSFINSMSVQ